MRPVTALLALAMLAASDAGAEASDTIGLRVGGMVITTPTYEGSKSYRVLGGPMLAPVNTDEVGRFQFRGIDDIRLRLLAAGGFEFGPTAGYRFGRDEDDGDRLRGLGDVDGGLALGAYGAFRFEGWMASIAYGQQLSGDEGGLLRVDLEHRRKITDRVTLRGGVGATWADDDHMQSRFGITGAQAVRSGLAPYSVDAGFKDVNVMLGATIELDPRWAISISGRYAHLIGDAADSPIVESESQFTAMAGLTYRIEIDNPLQWFRR